VTLVAGGATGRRRSEFVSGLQLQQKGHPMHKPQDIPPVEVPPLDPNPPQDPIPHQNPQ